MSTAWQMWISGEATSHIILRGLTLRGAARHGISLIGNVHDMVIEDCDISGCENVESDGWGSNFSRRRTLKRLIIQRNYHPRGDSTPWSARC